MSEHRLIAPRNNIVPYPEQQLRKPNGELEDYFMHSQELYKYGSLPQRITSSGFDTYASWLYSLQFTDPQLRERGGIVLLQEDPYTLIYPRNPAIGTKYEVTSEHRFNLQKFVPVVKAHSHFDSTCFSPTDLRRAILNQGIWSDKNDFYGNLVGTGRQNFLLLRTAESQVSNSENVEKTIDAYNKLVADINESNWENILRSMDNSEKPALFFQDILLNTGKNYLGADISRYLTSLASTLRIADIYKLGVYASNKDGIFKKMSLDDLQDFYKVSNMLFIQSAEKFNEIADDLD